ncbi:hypothetical protein [Microcystis aeruginosa]|nr:hypothetical protein [Microcystis aeruginosa]
MTTAAPNPLKIFPPFSVISYQLSVISYQWVSYQWVSYQWVSYQ